MTTYTIDPTHSEITFTVRHMVFAKVRGAFTRFEAKLAFDEQDPAQSSVTARIDA